MDVLDINPKNVLAIFAHPDDAETASGGTLSKYATNGAQVSILTIAQGDKGKSEPRDRDIEAKHAAIALGVSDIESIGYLDGEFENDISLRQLLVSHIRKRKPDLVICPDPTAVFFADAYINHRDHRITGLAVVDVVGSAVGNAKYFRNTQPHNVQHLLCAGSLSPNCGIDISLTLEKKLEAVKCYRSQLSENEEIAIHSLKLGARKIGESIGTQYAEAYRHVELNRVDIDY